MNPPPRATRRELLGLLVPIFLLGRTAAASAQVRSLDVDRIASRRAPGTRTARIRRYRVRAAVSLFSIPLLSKDNVGAACLTVEDLVSGSGRTTAIQFASGSWPDRINGFNRFGMTQEVVHEEDGAVIESAYLSFMTSSPEHDPDQAWRAFADRSGTLNLSVARGAADRTAYQCTLEHLPAPAGSTWMDSPTLMEELRSNNSAAAEGAAREISERAYPTFLHAVRKAMTCGIRHSRCTFMHNAKLYDLESVLSSAGGMTVLTGHITEQGSRSPSEFRLWFAPDDSSTLPVKIEFRPRSFLRLVFEQDMNAGGPTPRNLIPRESA